MTKPRWPVKVETRRSRRRKREPRTAPQPIQDANRTMFKPAPVRQNEVQAIPHAADDKNSPVALPQPGDLADDFARMLRRSNGRFPKDFWSPVFA